MLFIKLLLKLLKVIFQLNYEVNIKMYKVKVKSTQIKSIYNEKRFLNEKYTWWIMYDTELHVHCRMGI